MSDPRPSEPMFTRSAESATNGARPARPEGQVSLGRDSDPDEVVDGVLRFLDKDRYSAARQMAAEALTRFPDHPRVKRLWDLFDNRGKARVAPGGPEPSTREEFEWLKNPPEWARGKWVALVGSKVVASARTLSEVHESLRSMTFEKKPLVHLIANAE